VSLNGRQHEIRWLEFLPGMSSFRVTSRFAFQKIAICATMRLNNEHCHRDQCPGLCPFIFCHLDQPPLSSRTAGRDLMQPLSALRKASSATRDFSLRFEMTAGVASCPSPYREWWDFSLRSKYWC